MIVELIEIVSDAPKVVSIADFTAGTHGALVSGGGGDRLAAPIEPPVWWRLASCASPSPRP